MIVGDARLEVLGGPGEHGRGLLVPVQVLGLVAPEVLGVGEGVVVNFVLRVVHGGKLEDPRLYVEDRAR